MIVLKGEKMGVGAFRIRRNAPDGIFSVEVQLEGSRGELSVFPALTINEALTTLDNEYNFFNGMGEVL